MREEYKKIIAKFLSTSGQTTVEFILMLGSMITLVSTILVLFHEKIAGFFFFLVGSVVGSR